MGAAKTLRARRLELGLSELDLAQRAGMTVSEIGDIELRDDEIETSQSLGAVCRLLDVLGLATADVLDLPGTARLPVESVAEFLRRRRIERGYSPADLADLVGFEEATILSLESVPAFGRSLPIFLLKDIEDALAVPRGALISLAVTQGSDPRP